MKKWVEVLPNKSLKVTVIMESEEEVREFAELLSYGASMQEDLRREGCSHAMAELTLEVLEKSGKLEANLEECTNKVKERIHS